MPKRCECLRRRGDDPAVYFHRGIFRDRRGTGDKHLDLPVLATAGIGQAKLEKMRRRRDHRPGQLVGGGVHQADCIGGLGSTSPPSSADNRASWPATGGCQIVSASTTRMERTLNHIRRATMFFARDAHWHLPQSRLSYAGTGLSIYEKCIFHGGGVLVPTLCVGTHWTAAPRPRHRCEDAERPFSVFPRGAWEQGQILPQLPFSRWGWPGILCAESGCSKDSRSVCERIRAMELFHRMAYLAAANLLGTSAGRRITNEQFPSNWSRWPSAIQSWPNTSPAWPRPCPHYRSSGPWKTPNWNWCRGFRRPAGRGLLEQPKTLLAVLAACSTMNFTTAAGSSRPWG